MFTSSPPRSLSFFTTLATCVPLVACAGDDGRAELLVDERVQPIVYGDDDRLEVYVHPDARLRALARSSIVAFIPKERIVRGTAGQIGLSALSLGEAYALCSDQPFVDQPIASDCTGVLIDYDLVATAGHCFDQMRCDQFVIAFDYFYRAADELEPLSEKALYACKRIVAQEMRSIEAGQNGTVDYAVVQLDREARDRAPVRIHGQVDVAQALSVLGTSGGVPIKIDSGAKALSTRQPVSDYFTLDSDTFGGSSGSPVLNDALELVGIFVHGGIDYERAPERRCRIVNQLDSASDEPSALGEFQHEEATYATRAIDGLCAAGYPSPTLCQRERRCGDTFCTADEDSQTCPNDCIAPEAGVDGTSAEDRGVDVAKTASSRASGCSLSMYRQRATPPATLFGLFLVAYGRRRHGLPRPR